jgi:hypothetical protein
LAAALSLGASGGVFPEPSWWEIALRVDVKGGYVVRAGGRTYSGDFSGRTRWSGVLERDGEDFRLFMNVAEVPDWRLHETETRGDKILAARDGEARPRPVLSYVLRQGTDILLDFRLESLDIPLSPAPAAFRLPLPRSAESPRELGEPDYNAEVREGSNTIVLSDADVGGRPSEKTFRWTWESRRWGLGQAGTPSFTGRYTAEVVVRVTPRR